MAKICIVGCGGIGRLHARNFGDASGLSFCSRSRSSAEDFQKAFSGSGVFGSFDEVVDASEVDAVVICSPPEFHKDQVVRALSAGKAVLVEKPMCISLSEVDEIESALGRSQGGLLMVAENYYYKPSLAQIKALIAEGQVGEIRSVSVKKVSHQEAGGWKRAYGALLEGGIHFVALISDLFPGNPVKVDADFSHLQKGGSERHSVTRLEYEGGAQAELVYSWATKSLLKGTFQHSHIQGDLGRITFESNGIYVVLSAGPRFRFYTPGFRDLMGYRAMSDDFLACLGDRTREPYSDFRKAKRDLQIVFDAYRALPCPGGDDASPGAKGAEMG